MGITARFGRRVRRSGRLTPVPGADLRRILVLAAAVVVLAGVTTAALPASAEAHVGSLAWKASATDVIDGCTVVLNPTSAHFTECAGKDLSAANFSGFDLQFANFSEREFRSNLCRGPWGNLLSRDRLLSCELGSCRCQECGVRILLRHRNGPSLRFREPLSYEHATD